ncbi:helix-turn-helix domain-containing protein [Hydrogenophaga sp.]|uniref:helix-turn-helix domain-containing protein n=1 Tax=Hydrogenophaga sp. TaxID=1904254 RepID=UPI003F6D6057
MSDWSAQEAAAAVVTDSEGVRPLLLRQAREAAGLHIAALAAALKVPVKKLEALEAGRYEELPDRVFARALASSACRQLKVDPAPILEQIPAGVTPQLGDSGMAINTPFKAASGGAPSNPAGWLSRPAVLAAIALMLGALVLVFLPNMATSPEAEASAPLGDAPLASAVAPNFSEPAENATLAVASLAQPAPAADAAATGVVLAPALAPSLVAATVSVAAQTTASATGVAEPLDASKLLMIRATGDSWVEVTNGTGVVVIQRMLKSGDVVDFSAAPPYAVVVGRVDNAEVLVRGRAFDATSFARNGVARFEVK